MHHFRSTAWLADSNTTNNEVFIKRAPPNSELGTLYNQVAANNTHTSTHTHQHTLRLTPHTHTHTHTHYTHSHTH